MVQIKKLYLFEKLKIKKHTFQTNKNSRMKMFICQNLKFFFFAQNYIFIFQKGKIFISEKFEVKNKKIKYETFYLSKMENMRIGQIK